LELPPVLAELASSGDVRLADWVLDNPTSPYGRSLLDVLGNVMAQRSGQAQIVALTSAASSPGQSVTALALARIAVRSGLRTLLIDGDRGLLAPATPNTGLIGLLRGTPVLAAALKDKRSNVYCLAAVPGVWAHAGAVLAQLRQSCDLIVINAAPAGTPGVWPALARLTDAVVLLAPACAPPNVVEEPLRSLVATGASVRGLVITR
jgi:hypothetical protein